MKNSIPFLDNSEKALLKLIKEKKKPFLEYCNKEWFDPLFFTETSTTGWQATVRQLYLRKNPNYGMKLVILGRAIDKEVLHNPPAINAELEYIPFLEKLLEIFKLEIKPLSYFILDTTKLIRELIERGFSHKLDIINKKDAYYIVGPYGMVWPKPFYALETAKDIYNKFAIITHCTILPYKEAKSLGYLKTKKDGRN